MPPDHPSRSDLGEQESEPSEPDKTPAERLETAALGDEIGSDNAPDMRSRESNLDDTDGKTSFTYKNQGRINKARGKIQAAGRLKKKLKKKIVLASLASSVVIILVVVAAFFMLSLKLIHLVANIQVYEFARLSRNYGRAVTALTEEKIAMEAADESYAKKVAGKYKDFRGNTWGKLDKYRPGQVLTNLNSTKRLEYVFDNEPRKVKIPGLKDTKRVLKGVRIDGQEIRFGEARWWNYFEKAEERIKFNGRLTAQLQSSLHESNTLVRGRVASKLRDSLGIKLSRWERLTTSYKDGLAAQREAIRETARRTSSKPSSPGVDAVRNGVSEAERVTKETLDDDAKLNQTIRTRGQSVIEETDRAVSKATTEALTSTAAKIVGAASTLYAVAVPACLIYEGSVENSASVVDKNSERSIKSYYTLASAASQQVAGQAHPSQIGGLNDHLGNISNVPSELRAAGKLTTTAEYPNPQAGGAQYTLFDVLVGDGLVGDVFESIFSGACPTLTDIRTGLGLAAAEIAFDAASVVTGGAAGAAKTTFSTAIKESTQRALKNILTKKFAHRVKRDVALILTGSGLAKVLVHNHIGNMESGIPTGEDLAVQADQGANLVADNINREEFYGRPLTKDEVAMSNYKDSQDIAFKNSQTSVFERYLDPNNPNSALTNTAIAVSNFSSNSLSNMLRSLFAKIGSILQPGGNLMIDLLTGNQKKALAAIDNTNYEIIQWGWPESEENIISNNPDLYSPLNNAHYVETSGKLEEWAKAYDFCFTSSLGTLLANEHLVRDENGDLLADEGECSPNNLGARNQDAFRYRLYKRYEATLDHLAGIENISSSSAQTPLSSVPTPVNTEKVFVIGDSLTVGMQNLGSAANLIPQFKTVGIDAVVNAQGCRGLYQPNGPIKGVPPNCPNETIVDAFATVEANKDSLKAADTIVVSLGTNATERSTSGGRDDNLFAVKLQELVKRIRSADINPTAKIYWVNLSLPSSAEKAAARNKIIADNAATYDYLVLGWDKYVQTMNSDNGTANDIRFSDGVHHDNDGYAKKAHFIVNSIAGTL